MSESGEAEFEVIGVALRDASEAHRGPDIFYRCDKCGDVLPSQPSDNVQCQCGNVIMDIDYHWLVVEDFREFTVLKQS